MKRIYISTFLIATIIIVSSCSRVRRSPGRAYMPDMYYSRAYETYASTEALKQQGIFYSAMPVPGTVARGDHFPYKLTNDSTGYNQSATLQNPLDSAAIDMKEAERLYLVNCAICHGSTLNGDGPLFKGGDGPYKSKPATLVGDPNIEKLSAGTIFHVSTYGKGQMGSYAPQMSTEQRWMVAAYIKSKQVKKASAGKAGGADSTAAKPAGADSTAAGGTK